MLGTIILIVLISLLFSHVLAQEIENDEFPRATRFFVNLRSVLFFSLWPLLISWVLVVRSEP
jgi:hypothetical protein